MVDGVHGYVISYVVRHVVVEYKSVLEVVVNLHLYVEGGNVLAQVAWQEYVQVIAVLIRL